MQDDQERDRMKRAGELPFAVDAWAWVTGASSEVLAKLILPSMTGKLLPQHAEAGKEAGGSRGPAFPPEHA